MRNSSENFKQQAHALVNNLPDDATWSDLINSAAERQDLLESRVEYESGVVPQEVLAEYDTTEAERAGGKSS